MGCDVSTPKTKKGPGLKNASPHKDQRDVSSISDHTTEWNESVGVFVAEDKASPRLRSMNGRIDSVAGARSAITSRYAERDEPSLNCPVELRALIDNTSLSSSDGTSSSVPQLFRMSPTERAEEEPGTWGWWRRELRKERVTKDKYSRVQLQDIANRLTQQHDDDANTVEADFSNCFMERTAPYILGRLFASSQLMELRWITSLRLDGNYFTDDGFGKMLTTMSAANEKFTLLPVLRQLYLNNMNLDPHSVAGLFAYLFPVNYAKVRGLPPTKVFRIAGSCVVRPSLAYISPENNGPTVPLFPSLTVLSLSDNPSMGTAGLIQVLQNLVAVHYEPHVISVMDLSRCGMDTFASQFFHEFFMQLRKAIDTHCYPVVPKRFVLMGNEHGIRDPHAIYSPEQTGVQLVL